MDSGLVSGLLIFAFVSSITPGPNNLMLMTSGVNFGFRATFPHLLGVVVGHALMTVALGMGVSPIIHSTPQIRLVLKILGITYVIFLAWKIFSTSLSDEATDTIKGSPLSFYQAMAFQWINPKAWTLTLTAFTLYSVVNSLESIMLVTFAFATVNFPCVTAWTLMGVKLGGLLQSSRYLTIFNIAMASLLIMSVLPAIIRW
tara:strand:+ start:2804 stop:3406 length:603 start_codon:yes stop_codon:yes gene_type:complete